MTKYRATTFIPPLVKRAINLAEQMEYTCHCSTETGRLLQLLASQLQSGVIGEIGTGCGVAAAWIVSALSPGTSFFTVDEEPVLSAAVRAMFDPMLNVRVIQGEWREFLSNWRFALLYAGVTTQRAQEPELFLRSLRSGGMIVLDGLTPLDQNPQKNRSQTDLVREFWLNDPRVLAAEFMVTRSESVILATLSE